MMLIKPHGYYVNMSNNKIIYSPICVIGLIKYEKTLKCSPSNKEQYTPNYDQIKIIFLVVGRYHQHLYFLGLNLLDVFIKINLF